MTEAIELTASVDVQPTVSLTAEVSMGGGASESNAEAWAVGQRGGVDVPDTDPTYHNNAKWYAQIASGAVVSGTTLILS